MWPWQSFWLRSCCWRFAVCMAVLCPGKKSATSCGPADQKRQDVKVGASADAGDLCICLHRHRPLRHFIEDYGQSDVSVLRLNLAIRYHLRPSTSSGVTSFALRRSAGGHEARVRHGGQRQSASASDTSFFSSGLCWFFYFIDHLYIKVAYRILLFCLFSLFWFDMSLAVQGGVAVLLACFSHYWCCIDLP